MGRFNYNGSGYHLRCNLEAASQGGRNDSHWSVGTDFGLGGDAGERIAGKLGKVCRSFIHQLPKAGGGPGAAARPFPSGGRAGLSLTYLVGDLKRKQKKHNLQNDFNPQARIPGFFYAKPYLGLSIQDRLARPLHGTCPRIGPETRGLLLRMPALPLPPPGPEAVALAASVGEQETNIFE